MKTPNFPNPLDENLYVEFFKYNNTEYIRIHELGPAPKQIVERKIKDVDKARFPNHWKHYESVILYNLSNSKLPLDLPHNHNWRLWTCHWKE